MTNLKEGRPMEESYKNWTLYRQADGTIIGYRAKYRDEEPVDQDRVVTMATTVEEFRQYVDRHVKRQKKYDPFLDPAQMQIK